MIEGFDKEIDAILRQARNGQTVSADATPSAHLDADELAAFAENALPDQTKQFYVRHLADCQRCRLILANIISLSSEAEIETASSAVAAAKETPENIVPWYRKIFLFPQLTYAMGFLVLIFSGFLAYLLLLNPSKNSDGSQLSQIQEKAPKMPGAVANSNSMTINSSANSMMSNAASSSINTAANSSSSAEEPSPNPPLSSATASNKTAAPRTESVEREKSVSNKSQETPMADDRQNSTGVAAPAPPPVQPQPMILATRRAAEPKPEEKDKDLTKAEENKTADVENNKADSTPRQSLGGAPDAKPSVKKNAVAETRQSGGKTFTRKNGVWYDASYNNQPTINIARGSEEYKKLDSNLRSIAQSLNGTIVVVYLGKAYRIQ